ncbi:MAG: tetratricopeptide repeat-containing sensor histidine kinase [Bacteroidales bacterium]|nr:tetratricopeptide repeat-containing sensor histidine kinase [Bacteroidales bacterium]
MNRFFTILGFLLTISLLTFSNNSKTDSLLASLNKTEGVEKMEILRQVTREYMNNSVEDAIKYASQLLTLADEEGNLKYKDLACSFLGELYFYFDDIDKSIEYFENYLETNVQQEDIDGIATAYNNLGIVYRYIEKYEQSIEYYIKSLNIKEELNDSTGICNTLNNIGVLYFHMKDYYKALDYYKRSYEIEKALNNRSGIATSLLNIGEVYSVLNKYDKALSHFQRSIEICKNINDQYTLEINYKCLYDMYKQKIEFQKALYYFELFTDLKKERLDQETKKEIAELEIQYESNEKQKEIELLNKQNEFNQKIIIILSLAFFVFIVLLILLYIQSRSKKKAFKLLSIKNDKITEQSKILDNLNTTKDKFFSIISHDLKGAIGGFLTQTEFLAEDFNNQQPNDMHDLLKKMNLSSKQLYLLLENLLEWSRTQTESIKPNPEKFNLKELVDGILLIFKTKLQEKNIKVNVYISDETTVFADFNMISTVFRNLILNAIKFSYPDSSFEISSEIDLPNVQIKIKDQGVGISEKNIQKLFDISQSFSNPGTNREKGSGLGLIICKEFIETNGGEIWVESKLKTGSSFIFTLKLA